MFTSKLQLIAALGTLRIQPVGSNRRADSSSSNTVVRDFPLIAILTGVCRGNVQSMRWDELSLAQGTWRIPETKNGLPMTVHLPPAALRILNYRHANRENSPYVFPGHGKSKHLTEPKGVWEEVCKKAKIKDLRIHDLRRTLGSWQARGGASLPIIAKTLGYKDGSPATKVYARLNLTPMAQSVNAATGAMEEHMPKGLPPESPKQRKERGPAQTPCARSSGRHSGGKLHRRGKRCHPYCSCWRKRAYHGDRRIRTVGKAEGIPQVAARSVIAIRQYSLAFYWH